MKARSQVLRRLLGRFMDTTSNFIIKIKNAGNAGLDTVSVPFSKMKLSIAEVLKKEGFIKGFEERSEKGKRVISISLISENHIPKIKGVKRVSKPGLRVYKPKKMLPYVLNGLGIAIISTPKGVMTDKDARKQGVGGEIIAYVW